MDPPLPDLGAAALLPFIERIRALYVLMDEAYSLAAERAGFECRGCSDSCCDERFYHYTLAEHFFLLEGLRSLDGEIASRILDEAAETVRLHRLQDLQGTAGSAVCPLCSGGICAIYAYRPMICRLHGIPHTLRKKGIVQTGPGCHGFPEEAAEKLAGSGLDRTGFYTEMAAIEIELRRLTRFRGSYKKTVAGMIVEGLSTMDKSGRSVLL
jgi:Fe-S-cluster containining protein